MPTVGFRTLLPFLAVIIRPALAGWDATEYLIVRNITTGLVPDYVESSTVYPTGPVTPTSTSAATGTGYVPVTDDNGYMLELITTTSYLFLPTDATDLPIATTTAESGIVEDGETTTSITTKYYMPLTVSNPESCTLTDFTYTEALGLEFTKPWMRERATESDLALLVTTYESVISTNLGGQPVTTSRCDVYLKSDAIPVEDPNDEYKFDGLLSECVDPRPSVCTGTGQNAAATGSEGCRGAYPPTAAAHQEAPTGEDDSVPEPTETGGGSSWKHRSGQWPPVIIAGLLAMLLLIV
ncbi:hypothetical protein BJY01DRAFT_164981 [Aspergillus pseudoustus]|uniref:Uncharacterized protein n=1 Tax=Aspergillus pseudoustus TaxID=1810923 RepID=A0ABR4K5P6_9EURO